MVPGALVRAQPSRLGAARPPGGAALRFTVPPPRSRPLSAAACICAAPGPAGMPCSVSRNVSGRVRFVTSRPLQLPFVDQGDPDPELENDPLGLKQVRPAAAPLAPAVPPRSCPGCFSPGRATVVLGSWGPGSRAGSCCAAVPSLLWLAPMATVQRAARPCASCTACFLGCPDCLPLHGVAQACASWRASMAPLLAYCCPCAAFEGRRQGAAASSSRLMQLGKAFGFGKKNKDGK